MLFSWPLTYNYAANRTQLALPCARWEVSERVAAQVPHSCFAEMKPTKGTELFLHKTFWFLFFCLLEAAQTSQEILFTRALRHPVSDFREQFALQSLLFSSSDTCCQHCGCTICYPAKLEEPYSWRMATKVLRDTLLQLALSYNEPLSRMCGAELWRPDPWSGRHPARINNSSGCSTRVSATKQILSGKSSCQRCLHLSLRTPPSPGLEGPSRGGISLLHLHLLARSAAWLLYGVSPASCGATWSCQQLA